MNHDAGFVAGLGETAHFVGGHAFLDAREGFVVAAFVADEEQAQAVVFDKILSCLNRGSRSGCNAQVKPDRGESWQDSAVSARHTISELAGELGMEKHLQGGCAQAPGQISRQPIAGLLKLSTLNQHWRIASASGRSEEELPQNQTNPDRVSWLFKPARND